MDVKKGDTVRVGPRDDWRDGVVRAVIPMNQNHPRADVMLTKLYVVVDYYDELGIPDVMRFRVLRSGAITSSRGWTFRVVRSKEDKMDERSQRVLDYHRQVIAESTQKLEELEQAGCPTSWEERAAWVKEAEAEQSLVNYHKGELARLEADEPMRVTWNNGKPYNDKERAQAREMYEWFTGHYTVLRRSMAERAESALENEFEGKVSSALIADVAHNFYGEMYVRITALAAPQIATTTKEEEADDIQDGDENEPF